MAEIQDPFTPSSSWATQPWPQPELTTPFPTPVPTPAPPKTGKVFFGKYRYERCLGVGGVGMVYLVTHLRLGCPRALKLIPSDYASYEDARAVIGGEARANAAVSGHPNIMQVHDARLTRSTV